MSSYGRIYYVTFDVRVGNKVLHYIYHCWAWDAKEAKDLCKIAWSKEHNNRQFYLYAHRTKVCGSDLFLRVMSWNGCKFTGKSCIERFICTEIGICA